MVCFGVETQSLHIQNPTSKLYKCSTPTNQKGMYNSRSALTPPHYCSRFTKHFPYHNSQPLAGVISTAELKAASTIAGSPQVQLKEEAETRLAPDLKWPLFHSQEEAQNFLCGNNEMKKQVNYCQHENVTSSESLSLFNKAPVKVKISCFPH